MLDENKELTINYKNVKNNETIRENSNNNNEKIEESSNKKKSSKTDNFQQINKKYRKKRNYNEMKNSNNEKEKNSNLVIDIENEIVSDSDESKPFKKKSKNKIYPRLLKDEDGKHYYFTNYKNYEWQFLVIYSVKNSFYFKCSTRACHGFGMINRNDNQLIFRLTKNHDIDYLNHTYYIKSVCPNNLIKWNLTKEEWSKENIRNVLFKTYFINNKNATNESCKLYFKERLKEIFEDTQETGNEIKKCN